MASANVPPPPIDPGMLRWADSLALPAVALAPSHTSGKWERVETQPTVAVPKAMPGRTPQSAPTSPASGGTSTSLAHTYGHDNRASAKSKSAVVHTLTCSPFLHPPPPPPPTHACPLPAGPGTLGGSLKLMSSTNTCCRGSPNATNTSAANHSREDCLEVIPSPMSCVKGTYAANADKGVGWHC